MRRVNQNPVQRESRTRGRCGLTSPKFPRIARNDNLPEQVAFGSLDSGDPGPARLHEVEFGGYRILAAVHNVRVGRNALDWTPGFGAIAAEMAGPRVKSVLVDARLSRSTRRASATSARFRTRCRPDGRPT
jgi:hypothetical protein